MKIFQIHAKTLLQAIMFQLLANTNSESWFRFQSKQQVWNQTMGLNHSISKFRKTGKPRRSQNKEPNKKNKRTIFAKKKGSNTS